MSLSIGNISAKSGEKKKGFISVAEMPTGTVNIPVTLINGKKKGPRLLVTAGVHGCEYPGMRGAQIIATETDPEALEGSLIVVHSVNVPGFVHQVAFFNPLDGINLNRIWPGNVEPGAFYGAGSISHHITNNVYDKIQRKATHYIDLHGGDLPEDIPHFSASVMIDDRKVDEVSEGMLKYSLAKVIRAGAYSPGHTTSTAADLKIPHVLHEAGRAGLLEKDNVSRHVDAVKNIMKYLGMVEGKPEELKEQVSIGGGTGVRAKRGGFFESFVEPGEVVKEGQTLGKIYDVFGETLEVVKSPRDGLVLIVNFRAAKCVGDGLYSISEIII